MRRILLAGALLAVAGALAVFLGEALRLGLRNTLYGAAIGAVLGLVPVRSVVGRLGGFLLGVVFAWIGYAVRAQFLPDSVAGQVIAVVLVVLLITLASALTVGRIPMWSGLLGVAGLIGAYEFLYSAAPYNFLSDSVVAVSSLLVTVALGFLVGVVSDVLGGDDDDEIVLERPASPAGSDKGLAIMTQQGDS